MAGHQEWVSASPLCDQLALLHRTHAKGIIQRETKRLSLTFLLFVTQRNEQFQVFISKVVVYASSNKDANGLRAVRAVPFQSFATPNKFSSIRCRTNCVGRISVRTSVRTTLGAISYESACVLISFCSAGGAVFSAIEGYINKHSKNLTSLHLDNRG